MDLLTTILTCSLYASDDAVVRAIAEGPSGSNPYLVTGPVADSAEAGASPLPKNETEATARAKGLIAQGGRPLLGLLELLPAWLDLFGRPLSSAFDPCTNIAIGSAMLSEFDHECAVSARSRGQAPLLERVNPVSYTHLDVYKRQVYAQPMRITDIALEPGEKILGEPASGDVVRWLLALGKSMDRGVEQWLSLIHISSRRRSFWRRRPSAPWSRPASSSWSSAS